MIQGFGVGLSQSILCLYNWKEISTYYYDLKILGLKNSGFYMSADRWESGLKNMKKLYLHWNDTRIWGWIESIYIMSI